MNIPVQRHKTPISKLAQKYGRSEITIYKDLKAMGITKSREQFEKDALERRRIAYELRQTGLKWREVGEKMGISTVNAQMLGGRYKKTLEASHEQGIDKSS